MDNRPLKIALAGFGTVGGGLLSLIPENADLIHKRCGKNIEVKTVLVRDKNKARLCQLPASTQLTTNPEDLLADPEVTVLVELLGGLDLSYQLVSRALKSGKHVVTANKALLAEKGNELFSLAASNNCLLQYEASVAGAIPIIETLKHSLAGNRVTALAGILNGTSNYILSEMTSNALDFNAALQQAKELGYAEADPTLDIDGHDAAHKLILLIRLAFGVHYPYKKLSISGIRNLDIADIQLAREFGYRIKLIAQAKAKVNAENSKESDKVTEEAGIEAGVFPALVNHKLLLAKVGGVYNAIRLEANAAGALFLHGRGAGALPTAGAVLADLITIARHNQAGPNFIEQNLAEAKIVPQAEWRSRYYVRLMVRDAVGVLRDLSSCMADSNISLAQIIQKADEGRGVPLVFMTHETTDFALQNALQKIAKIGLLLEEPVSFRILDQD